MTEKLHNSRYSSQSLTFSQALVKRQNTNMNIQILWFCGTKFVYSEWLYQVEADMDYVGSI